MNELKNTGSQPQKENTERGMILLFIILLISTLLLSSSMFIYYSIPTEGQDTGKTTFSLNRLLEKGKETSSTLTKQTQQKLSETTQLLEEQSTTANNTKSARWPKLKLTGFGKSADGKGGFAIINGNQYNIGEPSGKVSLIEIQAHGVLLEYKGEQKVIYAE